MSPSRQKFLASYAADAREHLNSINQGLLRLERAGADDESLNNVFRSAHSLKGSSRMMKFIEIATIAHGMEDVFDALRGRRIELTPGLTDLLFQGIDAVASLVEKAANGVGPLEGNDELREALEKAAAGRSLSAAVGGATDGETCGDAREAEPPPTALEPPGVEIVSANYQEIGPSPNFVSHPSAVDEAQRSHRDRLSLQDSDSATEPSSRYQHSPSSPGATIRIDSQSLDRLISSTGELLALQQRLEQRFVDLKQIGILSTAARDHVLDMSSVLDSPETGSAQELRERMFRIRDSAQQLIASFKDDVNLAQVVFSQLRDDLLALRMVPLEELFETLPRVVRDTALSLGKRAQVQSNGGETRLDRTVVEKIRDPLLHLLRNSVDHGIEAPEERELRGKPQEGIVRVSARTEGRMVSIELADDGGGLAVDRLKDAAVRKGFCTAEALEEMTGDEVSKLIFLPGLSTTPIITDTSGRGVGMDVVRKNVVHDLQGFVDVFSAEGVGTRFHLKLPLSLATARVFLFRAESRIFAMPANSLLEIRRILDKDLVHVVDGLAIRIREQFVPVNPLGSLLRLSRVRPEAKGAYTVLVITNRTESRGLIVEDVFDENVVVVKSLPHFIRRNPFLSGVIVSGRNEIVFVLDAAAVIEQAKHIEGAGLVRAAQNAALVAKHLLVVDDSRNTLEIAKDILQAQGYKVSLARDGADALQKAARIRYDLIVTDVEMPHMDGFSLTRRLRDTEQHRYTPVIIITSRDNDEDRKRGIAVGADAYLLKGSFDQRKLLETVQELLGQGVRATAPTGRTANRPVV